MSNLSPDRKEWERHRETIRQLYLINEQYLKDVIETMKTQHGFERKKYQYEHAFKEWGWKKSLSRKEWKATIHRVQKRQHERPGVKLEVMAYGKRVSSEKLKKAMSRYNHTTTDEIFRNVRTSPRSITSASRIQLDTSTSISTPVLLALPTINAYPDKQTVMLELVSGTRETMLERLLSLIREDMFTTLGAESNRDLMIVIQLSNNRGDGLFESVLVELCELPENVKFLRRFLEQREPSLCAAAEKILAPAAYAGNMDLVKMLVECGISPDCQGKSERGLDYTPLEAAIASKHRGESRKTVAEYLLEHGADPNAQLYSRFEFNSLVSFAARMGNIEILKCLFNYINTYLIQINMHSTMKHAALSGDLHTIDFLIEQGFDINEDVEDLLSSNADPNYVSGLGGACQVPPIIIAARSGNIKVVQLLLQVGADPDKGTPRGHICYMCPSGGVISTALQCAFESGDLEIATMLKNFGATLPDQRQNGLWDPLRSAFIGGDPQIIDAVLHRMDGLGLECRDYLQLLLENRKVDVARDLFEKGVLRTGRDTHSTGVICAVISQNLASDRSFVEGLVFGTAKAIGYLAADVARVGLVAASACLLDYHYSWPKASRNEFVDQVNYLLEAGADVNCEATPVAQAAHVLRRQSTPLQYATQNNDVDLVHMVMEHGAEVNAKPAHATGATALQFAAINGNFRIVEFLFNTGAKINAARSPHHGRTAIEGASEQGRLDMVCYLLNNGADVRGRLNQQYRRSVYRAWKNGHYTLARMIQSFKRERFGEEDLACIEDIMKMTENELECECREVGCMRCKCPDSKFEDGESENEM
ncbi:ankyrin repeat-containing domain protein [Clohesyomyces aquaticus]|uniref:Ankyrin repeat-containing domain protein n=1 Tax=Clohesyomyces aquaticus TaxID=1231657 RepID=A0A1Y1YY94_9PLEO|nr:ankyrin repeat-containing domain protein [Clohesyomyces aquaticus]